jgi:hypothetical protein
MVMNSYGERRKVPPPQPQGRMPASVLRSSAFSSVDRASSDKYNNSQHTITQHIHTPSTTRITSDNV